MKLSPQIDSSFEVNISKYKENIELEIERVLDVEKQITVLDQIEVFNIQLQIDKIIKKIRLTPLNEARLYCFEERVEEIYAKYEPTTKELIHAELLMQDKIELLD